MTLNQLHPDGINKKTHLHRTYSMRMGLEKVGRLEKQPTTTAHIIAMQRRQSYCHRYVRYCVGDQYQ